MNIKTLLLAFTLITGAVFAADHIDSPATVNDPLTDMLDFYVFLNPNDPEELILALTISPFATGATQFSDAVIYHFYFENEPGLTAQIDCAFSREQVVSCTAPGDLSVQSRVGEIGVNGDIRVFAGLREDPFFFDFEAFVATLTTGEVAFTNPGVDFFAGANTLGLVIGIDRNAISPQPGTKAHFNQKVWVASERIAGDGVNGGLSGSWYNPDQSGQGWVIEVVNNAQGSGITPKNHAVEQFVVYFYGYDNGEQLWLQGNGANIAGNTATVDVIRTSGTGFGPGFDPANVMRETVGSMSFTFSDCNSATTTFTPSDDSLTGFTTDIQRLTNISALGCSLFTSGQIDREGRPTVNSVLISGPLKDAYNAASDPSTWAALFTDEIAASLAFTDGLDGIDGNLLTGDEQTLAAILVDDRIQIDLSIPQCGPYLALESAALGGTTSEFCGGRTLEQDVVDITLSAVVSGFEIPVGDGVDSNDVAYLTVFPFLAPPH